MIHTNVCKLGNNIGFRGKDEDGKRVQQKLEFFPELYVSSPNDNTEYKDIYGNPVESIQPGSMWECKKFIEDRKSLHGYSIHGQDNWTTQFISTFYDGFPRPEPTLEDLNIGYVDIETECEVGFPSVEDPQEKINAISLTCGNTTHVFGVGDWTIETVMRDYIHHKHVDEVEMLEDFLNVWTSLDLDVVTGWNCKMFDIPYLVRRIKKLMGGSEADRLSPWNKLWEKNTRDDYGNFRPTYSIYGISILDYMELYKKYILTPRESYKLDFIAQEELGYKKLDWQSHYSSMSEFYKKDFQMFIEYNIIDVDILVDLEKKLRLLELHVNIAYTAMVNPEDVFSPVKTWDAIIYNHLKDEKVIIPIVNASDKSEQYAGAYVKEPEQNMYEWVVSFDLASLYPSLIMQYNISPDTLVVRDDLQYLKDHTKSQESIDAADTLLSNMNGDRVRIDVDTILKDGVPENIQKAAKYLNLGVAANGHLFNNRKQGFLSFLMEDVYVKRKQMKNKMIDAEKKLELIKAEMHKRGLEDDVQ